jgi:arylsulfatase A-like enzyme
MADDLGYGDLGCYGQARIKTPQVDKLATEGMRFTQCYAGSTVCAPSRSCLMTGQHTGHTLVRGNARIPLRQEDTTVAEVLKDAGYATGIVGKWGLGEPDTTGVPNRQGFDYWFGYLNQRNAHNYYPEYLWRNEERHPLPDNENDARGAYTHDLFTEDALRFIDDHRHHPFFLYLPYTIPHANNELGRETGDGMEVPSQGDYAHADWPDVEKNTAAMISRLDSDVGRIMERLQDLGIDEDTVVFFTSDNGPHREGGHDADFFDSRGPLRGIKRDLYEGGIRVPMIARWPGVIPRGVVSDTPWAFWDLLPTAADIAGAVPPEDVDGVSVLPALRGEEQTPHEYLYWEFYERGFDQAVRMGPWKGVRRSRNEDRLELYNLDDDIGETTDIAAEHPGIASRIAAVMREAHADNEHYQLPEAGR